MEGCGLTDVKRYDGYCILRLVWIAGELVAESCADGDLVTALGAAAVQDGSTGLGLHAGKKPMGLRAMAAVRLKGTLRHGNNS
jgi:hypothetical protein